MFLFDVLMLPLLWLAGKVYNLQNQVDPQDSEPFNAFAPHPLKLGTGRPRTRFSFIGEKKERDVVPVNEGKWLNPDVFRKPLQFAAAAAADFLLKELSFLWTGIGVCKQTPILLLRKLVCLETDCLCSRFFYLYLPLTV